MGFVEYMAIAIAVLLVVVIVLQFVFRAKSGDSSQLVQHFDSLEDALRRELEETRANMTSTVFKSMLEFNTSVNAQLSDSGERSVKNIAEFQDKLNTRIAEDFKGLSETLNLKMAEINTKVEDRLSKGFSETNQTFVQIAERVKVIDEAQKNIESLSNEMIGLQNILTNNQSRGSFGELSLAQILFAVYGEQHKFYEMQYTIREQRGKQDYVRADAVVFLPEPNGMIAIDSKFAYSAYAKLFNNKDLSAEEESKLLQQLSADVKKQITEIASKYIIPGKTSEYAVMFVPNDGVLALIHSKLDNVTQYAAEKRVTIASPTTLIPLLSTLKVLYLDYERSQHSVEITKQLLQLKKQFAIFEKVWTTLNNNIQSLTSQSATVNSRVEHITQGFTKIQEEHSFEVQNDDES